MQIVKRQRIDDGRRPLVEETGNNDTCGERETERGYFACHCQPQTIERSEAADESIQPPIDCRRLYVDYSQALIE